MYVLKKQVEYAGTTTRVMEADLRLIFEYRRRPVLVVPVLGPVCQHAAVAAIINGQFGASVYMSWAISSNY